MRFKDYVKYNKKYGVYVRYDGEIFKDKECREHVEMYLNKSNSGRSYPCFDTQNHHRVMVHRVVAFEFVDGWTKEKYIVDHIDNNPMNYHPSNLRYVTQSENIKASYKFRQNRCVYKLIRK